jgi:hypothetical protein
MRYTVEDPNAATKLGLALSDAQDGDEIVVRTSAAAELAKRGAKRLNKSVSILVIPAENEWNR